MKRRPRSELKPLLTPLERRYMRAIYGAFWSSPHYHGRGVPRWQAEQAACDTLDGWAVPSEWRPLVRKGLLVSVPCEREDWRELASEQVREFVVLSPKGLFLMHHWRLIEQARGVSH